MIRVKSFEITDDAGINELLSSAVLAENMGLLISNGKILVPYEDGEPLSQHQKSINIRRDINKLIAQSEIIKHSQHMLDLLMDDAEERLNAFEADLAELTTQKGSKEKAEKTKQLEKLIKDVKGSIIEMDNQKRLNEHEIMRLTLNVRMYEEQINDNQETH